MTKIECIIRPGKMVEVKEALGKVGIHGMTVTEAIGCGLQKGHTETGWNTELGNITLLPKTKLELIVRDEMVDAVVQAIIGAARTGEIGDGKIFTYPVGNAIRIRTGEAGDAVL